jgi:hypothetical protein
MTLRKDAGERRPLAPGALPKGFEGSRSVPVPNKKWEVLFWGAAIAIFIFAGCVMIFVSHFR